MKATSNPAAAAMLLFATFSWGSLFHAGKAVVRHVDPWWFATIRYAGAVTVLVLLLSAMKALRWRLLAANARRLAFFGFAGYAFFGTVVFLGLQHTAPSHAAVIMATMPVSTIVLRSLLDRRWPAAWTWAVAALALGGVSVISGAAVLGSSGSWQGNLVVYLGSLGWVTYTVGQGSLPELDPLEYATFGCVLAFPMIVAATGIAELAGFAHAPDAQQLRAVAPELVYIVLVPTVAAVLAYNRGIRALGAVNGILFINVVPVSSLLIGVAGGHPPTAAELAGCLLVVAALILQNRMLARMARLARAKS